MAIIIGRWGAGMALATGLSALLAPAGCNAIIGATDPIARQEEASVGESCVLNSDCTTAGQVCIFRVCSPPCHTDSDCADGSRCLRTDVGTACVVDTVASCPNGECPSGATCQAGACRNTCGKASDCLVGQACVGGACVGTDPTHDTGLDAGRDGSAPPDASDASEDRTVVDGSNEAPVEAGEDSTVTADSGLEAAVEAGCGDTASDVHNCGVCGHDCAQLPNVSASGLACASGRCVYQCAAGTADCADAGAGCQTDVTKSPNCGTCGTSCGAAEPNCGPMAGSPGGYACQNGCPASASMLCGMNCVDTNTSNTDCGGCNMPCTTAEQNATAQCTGGACKVSCAAGYSPCGNACVDLQTDNNNCGVCTMKCSGGDTCSGGTCQCASPLHVCGGQCTTNDTSACGATCAACVMPTGGTVSCDGIQCKQACSMTGYSACSNVCVDTSTDPGNCGMCGITCTGTSTPYCVGSACVACTTGQTKCYSTTQVQSCTTGGQWGSPTTCTDACVGTGVGSNCGGMCVPGTSTCSDNTHSELCGSNGVYGAPVACAVSSPSCANGNCPYYAGESGGGTITDMLVAGNVYATPITVTANAKIYSLGMYTTATGSNVNIGIYSNTAQNTPGSLLTSTGHIATLNGSISLNVNPVVTLSANTTYWIGAISQASITIEFASGTPGVAAANNPGMWPALPSSFPAGGPFLTSETPSFFAVLQNQ